MNVDTDTQYAYLEGIRDFILTKKDYLMSQVGNPEGADKPNKKQYDPVRLHPELLREHQDFVREQLKINKENPVFLVFHGGSGSEKHEIATAVNNGIIKMNVDTDTQYAYLEGIRDFILTKKDYLMSQVGNPEGADKPNKKQYDPRVWVREGEKTMGKRCQIAFDDLRTSNHL